MVVTRETMRLGAPKIVEFLRGIGVSEVGFLPSSPGSGAQANVDDYLPRDAYFRFLLDVEHVRRRDPELWLAVRELDAILLAASGQAPGFCELLGGCLGSYYAVEVDGDIAHCDKFVGDDRYVLGNVRRKLQSGPPIASARCAPG